MDDDNQKSGGIDWGYLIYQQTAAVFGAFALIAFLSHFIEFDWRGALHDLVAIWAEFVRPAVKALVDATFVALLKFVFNWTIEVPTIVHDYLSVGIVFALSLLRAIFLLDEEDHRPLAFLRFLADAATNWDFWKIMMLMVVAWPLWIPIYIRQDIGFPLFASDYRMIALWFAPIVYLLLLLAANYFLLSPAV